MKRLLVYLVATLLLLALASSAFARNYDFSAVCESGQTLYYKVVSSTPPYTVKIVAQNASSPYYNTYPTGSLVIPSSVERGLTGSTYSVVSIGSSAFRDCSGLTSVTIPNSVTSIESYAFYNCSGLTGTLRLPSSVSTIGSSAFYNCTGLTTLISAGASAGNIGNNAFYNVRNIIRDVTSETGTPWGALTLNGYVDGYLVYKNSYKQFLTGCISKATTITIPNSVTSIGQRAFSGCNRLTTVNFNATNCTSNGASWNDCTSLINLNIGSNVTNIPDYAFQNCRTLTSVTIPNSVTNIGERAFSGCSGLTEPVYNASWFAYIPIGYATEYTIPNGIQHIAGGAFYNLSELTSVTIPNSVTSIGERAFYGCSGMTSITIPNSVTIIGSEAFKECGGLVEMTIPFVGGSATATEASASTLFGYIFGTRTGGTAIQQYYSQNNSITYYIPSSLRSVTVTSGRLLYGAFYGCSMLTSVTIGDGVTSICPRTFRGCISLRSLTIGSSVSSISSNVFYNCYSLGNIYIKRTTPPYLEDYSYGYGATLWVPCGSAEAYRTDPKWNQFSDIRESRWYLLNVSSANQQQGTANVTQQPDCIDGIATIAATPNRGYVFSQWDDGDTENPRTITVTEDVEYTASFVALPSHTITVLSANETMGTATGGGIYYDGETATLTATPLDGYGFVAWSDGNTDNPRTITITEDATYTATFGSMYTITVLSANETMGTVIGNGEYVEGSVVQITAVPNEHYHFVHWIVEENPTRDIITDNPLTITITSDITYTAVFAIDQHTIMVESNNEAMGTVSDGGTYDYGTEIQISATANEGYGFAAWNDGNTDNPRTITVTGDATYIAIFGVMYTITVLSTDETMGTVSEGGAYLEGSQVEISANAAEHYHFVQWNDENTDNPRTIMVTSDSTFTATFAIDQHTITVESADASMGTVSESGTYDYGTEIQISATANEHYHFVQWSDGNTDNPRNITVTGDVTYTAQFAPDQYTITVESADETMGTVTGGGTFDYGTERQISATALSGYQFAQWSDGNTDNPRTITVTGDATYVASFVPATGIDETSAFEIALFPNPATDVLNITSSEIISEIEIVNTLGQVVKRIEVNADNAVCDVEELKAGVYVVRIRTASATLSQRKFVKE